MRIFLMVLIFAIGFSGYSAAAHAFSMDSCGKAALEKSIDQDKNCADHQGHQAASPQDDHGHKSGKTVCLDCHHCCAAPMAGIPAISMNFPPPVKAQHVLPSFGYSDDLAFSFLRPPRTLV